MIDAAFQRAMLPLRSILPFSSLIAAAATFHAIDSHLPPWRLFASYDVFSAMRVTADMITARHAALCRCCDAHADTQRHFRHVMLLSRFATPPAPLLPRHVAAQQMLTFS